MKKWVLLTLAGIVISTSMFAQNKKMPKNRLDSVSYAVGISMYEGSQQFRLKLNYDMVAAALKAAEDSSALMSLEDANAYINQVYQQVRNAEIEENIKLGEKFLAENKKVNGIKVTQTGLQYRVIKQGSGPLPAADDRVKVNYKGYLLDGKVFDSSYDRGSPAVFNLQSVIKGWTEIIQMMPVGSEYVVYIPPYLAYGDKKMGDIPGGSTLIFEIQLLEIFELEQ